MHYKIVLYNRRYTPKMVLIYEDLGNKLKNVLIGIFQEFLES